MEQKPTYAELSLRIKALEQEVLKHKQLENTLHDSQAQYTLLIKNLPCVVYRGFKDFSVEFMDTKIEAITGYNVEEFNSKKIKWHDLIVKEDLENSRKCFIQALKTDKSYVREYRIKSKTGEIRWTQERGHIVCDNSGEIDHVSGVYFDITELKQAEEALKITQFTVERAQDAIYWVGPDARFIYANDAACRALGYAREELLTMSVYDVNPQFPAKIWPEHWAELQRRGSLTFETLNRGKDGKDFPVELAVNFIKIGNREFNCAFARDITERKKMQIEFVKAQKFEAIGTLVQGVAHDYNNLLSIIMGYISLAAEDLKSDSNVSEFLQEAEKAALRAQELTNRLISFSKGAAPDKKSGSIANLIKETADFFLQEPHVTFEFFILPDLWQVEFDQDHMKHVIKNLMVNAVEAMPAGGTIDVRAENIKVAAGTRDRSLPLSAGNYIKISIHDQGLGIPKEHLSKIFDPYFSTKELGTQKGMGLGLATAYSIIKKHKGFIAVESEVGIGTTFTLYLPALEKITPNLDPAPKSASKKPATITGRILVMDDEEMIRNIAKQILRRLGYKPELAKDGAEAIEIYQRAMNSGQPFDAVILDLTVKGGIGGKEALKTLLTIDPQVNAVVSSGYSKNPEMTDFRAYGFTAALTKPYQMKDLADVLLSVA